MQVDEEMSKRVLETLERIEEWKHSKWGQPERAEEPEGFPDEEEYDDDNMLGHQLGQAWMRAESAIKVAWHGPTPAARMYWSGLTEAELDVAALGPWQP